MNKRSGRTLAVAVAALVMPLGMTVATAPATVASPDQVVQVQEAAKKKGKSSPAKAAAEARKAAQKAAKEAKQAEKAATNADRAVKKALVKAQKAKKAAQKSGSPAAKAKNAAAWKAVQKAKQAKKKAEKALVKTAKKAEQTKVQADKKTAAAATVKSVSIDALPAIAQQGASPAGADQARNVVVVKTSPAISHIPLKVQAQTGGGWSTVASAVTGQGGLAEVAVPQASTYRVIAKEKTSAPDTVAYRLDYSDEFRGGALGADWHHRVQHYNPEGLRACSKGDPRATTMTGDTLRLWVLRDPDRADKCAALRDGKLEGPYSYRLNGHVSTEKSYSFQYGVAAARMKFQKSAVGQHSSFWLQPVSHTGRGVGPEHQGAEIDVIEYFGSKQRSSGLASFTYHNNPAGQRVKTGGILEDVDRFLADKNDNWMDRYHVFSVEWTPSEYIFRIDGKESFRSKAGISHRPQFLILSLLSSDYAIANAGAAGEAELGSQSSDVDWVRVWK